MSQAARIYLWFLIFVFLAGAALFLPGVTAAGQTGIDAGITAALTFIVFGLLAVGVAISQLWMAIRHRATLPFGAKLAGVLPILLVFVGALYLYHRIQQSKAIEPQPPRAVTAPQAVPGDK